MKGGFKLNNLFFCKTPYQLIVVTQLVIKQFSKDSNDILISDTIANCQELLENVKVSGVFKKARIYSSKEMVMSRSKGYFVRQSLKSKLMKSTLKKSVFNYGDYDRFFICNLSYEETFIYRILKQVATRPLKVYLFEDGFSSYSKMYGDFFEMLKPKREFMGKIKFMYKKMVYEVFMNLQGFYVFSPELLDWNPQMPVFQLFKIGKHDSETISTLNSIFGVKKCVDVYDKNYMFFEESYFADGQNIGDLEIVDQISSIIGRENIFVKIHPRNLINRFDELGYQTNRNTAIPWEIIALNIDMNQKVLFTIASGSALTSLINTSIVPKKVIMLMNCEEMRNCELTPSLEMLRKVANHYPETVICPHNFNELTQILTNLRSM